MKSKAANKKTVRKQPYNKSGERARVDTQRAKSAAAVQIPATKSAAAVQDPSTALSASAGTSSRSSPPPFEVETAREAYMDSFNRAYPHITPRDEYDVVTLASTRREGTAEELYAWVDKEMEREIKNNGSREAVMANVKALMDTIVGTTGRKPRPGRDVVHTRPIPGSKYSIRLWPGDPYVSEYCMDFVDTATNEAVNSPFEFELWAIPDPDAPWLCMPSGRVQSLERNFHIPEHKILPGEEKWVLRDGQTCLLKRPGKRDVLFRVPARKPRSVNYDYDVVEFPRVV